MLSNKATNELRGEYLLLTDTENDRIAIRRDMILGLMESHDEDGQKATIVVADKIDPGEDKEPQKCMWFWAKETIDQILLLLDKNKPEGTGQ